MGCAQRWALNQRCHDFASEPTSRVHMVDKEAARTRHTLPLRLQVGAHVPTQRCQWSDKDGSTRRLSFGHALFVG